MRRAHSILILSGALLGAPACTEVDPQPGQLGGPCRASFNPCDGDLVCNGNGCQAPTGEVDADYDVTFTFKDGKTAVNADGVDTTIVTVRFFQTVDGISQSAPANLQFRMWVDPPSAGQIEFAASSNPEVAPDDGGVPYRLADASSSATVRFTGCDKALSGCPRFATIKVATAPNALLPIASTPIENLGAGLTPTPEPDGMEPEAIPTPALPDGYGPFEQCAGSVNEIYLKGDDNAQAFQGPGERFAVDSWRLRNAIRPNDTDDLIIEMESDTLGASMLVTISTISVGSPLEIAEYDAVDTAVTEEGMAQFNLQFIQGGQRVTCSREMERRFAVQNLRIANGAVQHLALSFLQACDGGIVQGCFNIQPIEMGQ